MKVDAMARSQTLVLTLTLIVSIGAFVAPSTKNHRHLDGTPSSPLSRAVVGSRHPEVLRTSSAATKEDAGAASNVAKNPTPPSETDSYSKLRRLKDVMWVRETLEDLTAAEFACSLDAAAGRSGATAPSKKSKRKRAVDFENLLSKLDKRVNEMCVAGTTSDAKAMGKGDSCYPLGTGDTCFMLVRGKGMGCVVYGNDARKSLLLRLLSTRDKLIKVMEGNADDLSDETNVVERALDRIRVQLQNEAELSTGISESVVDESEKIVSDKVGSGKKAVGDPMLYVRDDGTVDWDGALQDRAALRQFGTSVWARINGQDPESVDEDSIAENGVSDHDEKKEVLAKIIETDAIREKKALLESLEEEYSQMEAEDTALLNSAVKAGSLEANVNFAMLEPELRSKIRLSSDNLEKKREEVEFQTLNYELERIYTYLEADLGNTATKGYIPLQDRLYVAEFGLLESQVDSFNKQLEVGEFIDADTLAIVSNQLADFKRRLGIDYYVTGFTYDQKAVQRWTVDLLAKAKNGVTFYIKGCRLLWSDVVFSLSLVGRALQGYTLKPREVRTLRRTSKDVITFIPVVIILIIPLSPVGHVLVFGAIQRFFPDFFPSCFTERRQNLLQLYESTEYTEVTINETWQEKVARLWEAIAFIIVEAARRFYVKITGKTIVTTETSEKSTGRENP